MNKDFIKNNQSGITIFISVLVLASVIILALAISDLVLRTSRSSKKIGLSEVAYYAAESSIEKALYQIEKNRTISGLSSSGNLSEITAATWDRTVSLITSYATDCDTLGSNEGICVETAGTINSSNTLHAKLDAGSSFQLDLDFTGMALPNNLQVSWSGSGKVVAYGSGGQLTDNNSPTNLNDLDANLYVFRIDNEDTSLIDFEIAPSSGADLPIGFNLTATGDYQDQQRVIETIRNNWQIY